MAMSFNFNNAVKKIDQIIHHSGDSFLEKFAYSEGVLTIDLNLTELDKQVRLIIRTNDVSFADFNKIGQEDIYRTCRIEVQDLLSILSLENNIYVPSTDFGRFMNETRQKYHLAYGKKSAEIKYIFSLVGYDRLVSCVLSDLASITVEEND